ncbi:MAG: transcription termination factor Rho [Acidimicrobiaceae bacterium]|nr:transcription termination factor Rho [Acidimicrobiaceae bacterium]
MSTNDADRADLESKDKDSLIQIAIALGGKPTSRAKKAEIIDLILELASEEAGNSGSSEGNHNLSGNEENKSGESRKQSSEKSRGYSADPMADARAEANGDNGQNGDDEPQEGTGRGRRRRGRSREGMEEWSGDPVEAEGYLDLRDDGYGFLRVNGFLPSRDDVYVPVKFVRQYGLRKGDHLIGAYRPANRSEKNPAMLRLDAVNGVEASAITDRPDFTDLTPVFPDTRLKLERPEDPENTISRSVDLLAPIAKGQRALLAAPIRSGKTAILKEISQSIETSYSEVKLLMLLVEAPPEEVTEMKRWLTRSDLVASTFDQPPEEHIAIAELTIERAKRMVELGEDVVVVVDGMTHLARAYTLTAQGSSRLGSGDLDASALYPPKRFFGSGRKVEEGGSLTVIATVLSETQSKVDELVLNELQGGSTMELHLCSEAADAQLFPGIDVRKTMTKNVSSLYSNEEQAQSIKLREELKKSSDGEDRLSELRTLLGLIGSTEDNAQLLENLGTSGAK